MTTPCGETTITRCPGPEITLSLHEHQLPDEGKRHSIGSKAFRDLVGGKGYDEIDAKFSNWCRSCQRTLLRCARMGCRRARSEAEGYAYAAAAFTLAALRKASAPWDPEQEDLADHVARRKALSNLAGNPGNPDAWDEDFQPSSLITWFSNYIEEEIGSELARLKMRAENDLWGVRKPTDIDSHEEGWNQVPSHLLGPDRTVIIDLENASLKEALKEVVDVILEHLEPLAARGAAPRPALLMLVYLADFEHNRRLYPDGRYGIARTSDKTIAKMLGLGENNSPIDRTRTEDLIPTCDALLLSGDLTDLHKAALRSIINHLRNRPVTEAPAPGTPKKVQSATTSTDPHHDNAGPQ